MIDRSTKAKLTKSKKISSLNSISQLIENINCAIENNKTTHREVCLWERESRAFQIPDKKIFFEIEKKYSFKEKEVPIDDLRVETLSELIKLKADMIIIEDDDSLSAKFNELEKLEKLEKLK